MPVTKEIQQGLLLSIGHPIMDITAVVDPIYLDKYHLKPDDMTLATESHHNLYSELSNQFDVQYTAGGAAQNTIRVAQYYLKKPFSTTFVGCIGKDEVGAILTKTMRKEGIHTEYMVSDEGPTGCCAVLVTGRDRSLVTRLGAAQHYKQEHLESSSVEAYFKQASCIYCVGYMLNVVGPHNIMLNVAKYATMNDKIFVANLGAPFLCHVYKQELLDVIRYTDILFGNRNEAQKFANEMNYETSNLDTIVKKMSDLQKENTNRCRIVIITCGAEPTVVCKEGQIYHYPIIPIDAGDIVDTNGAGDAFVGGFLAKFVQECSFEECMRNASAAANMIIKQIGCTLPDE